MTFADVLIQVLSEVMNKPKKEIEILFKTVREKFPDQTKMDQELSDEQAHELLNKFRDEKSGILAWIVKGAIDVGRHEGHA